MAPCPPYGSMLLPAKSIAAQTSPSFYSPHQCRVHEALAKEDEEEASAEDAGHHDDHYCF